MVREFAPYLKTVARGSTLPWPLDAAEAEAAFGMILDGVAVPMQVGAFLPVLRQRGETAAQLTGLVRAACARLALRALPVADLDWPSYADAHRQLPYFLLAALLVADAGVRVLMHGGAGASGASTRRGLAALGLAPARDGAEAAQPIAACGLAYLPLETLCPPLAQLLALKPVLGVRTAVNSVARELNPAGASAQIQGVFHPPYMPLHVTTQLSLGQPRALTFKGGSEGQRDPNKPCRAIAVDSETATDMVWPSLNDGPAWPWRDEPLEPHRLEALWRGDWSVPARVVAVTGTAAMVLWLAGHALDSAAADRLSEELWVKRARGNARRAA